MRVTESAYIVTTNHSASAIAALARKRQLLALWGSGNVHMAIGGNGEVVG